MLNTFQQADHPILPKASHDERSRQEFAKSMRGYLQREILPGLTPLYRKVSSSAANALENRHQVRKAMTREPFFQGYAALNRTAQELVWNSIIDSIEHDWPRLSETANDLAGQGGQLRL